MPPYPAFVDASYQSQSPITDQEYTFNWLVELADAAGATAKASLYPVPGFRVFASVTRLGGRAMFATGSSPNHHASGRAFQVVADTLYEVLGDGTTVNRGTVAVDSNPATICTNGDGGDQLFLTSGNNGYCFDLLTNTLTQVLTGAATQGGELYGYFVAFDAGRNQIRISALFDGTTWDPTQFLARSIGSDPWTAMLVTPYGNIFLPGSQTGEFLYNAATFPFPFAPDPSGLIEEGIAATFSIQQAGKSAVWLSTNRNGGYQVQRAAGYTPQRISTHAIEDQIAGYPRIDDALGQTYEDRGHAFYLLTFPTAGVTHVYDFTTGKWHDRGHWIAEQNRADGLRPTFHCFAFNKHLMADRTTGITYEMDASFGLDIDGRPLRRIRRAPALVNQRQRVFFPLFEILLQAGVGLASGAGSDPLVMMRKSDDGGRTWSNERRASAGPIGQYGRRLRFLNTGSARLRVFEISVSDPVPWRITDAYLQLGPSTEAAA